jgi:hypothetical protein
MGQLDEARFESLVATPCAACQATKVEIRTFLDRRLAIMAATPNDEGKWAHDGEKFIDGIYRIACASCGVVRFESADCPRCHAGGGLSRALGDVSRLVPPKRCAKCNELELLAVAMVHARAKFGGGERPKPEALAEYGEPGHHVVAYACDSCDSAVVAEGCPLCGAPGPLRQRP